MNKLIELNNIKSIDILFENCECIKVPVECFKEFDIEIDNTIEKEEIDNFNANLKSLKCKIIDNGNIEYSCSFNEITTPISRIFKHNDITAIYLYDYKDNEIELRIPWGENNLNNYNQHSKLISYKEIELYIAENSREYTLEEALEELKDGDVIIDTKGKEYTLYEDENGDNCLVEGIINLKLLNEKFTKKVSSDND